MLSPKCSGDHEIYVAEVVGVESAGKICCVTVCRHCDMVTFHEHTISTPGNTLRLKKEETKNELSR